MSKQLPPILLLGLMVSGCVHYRPQPLSHRDVVARYERLRTDDQEAGEAVLTFAEAQALMDRNNRRLKEIRQAYQTMQNVADIPTPWPNPSISTGFKHGVHLPNGHSASTQPFVSLGFAVPLTSRLSRQDDLNSTLSHQKATELKTEHRRLFLKLRQVYGTLYFLQQKRETLQILTDFVQWKLDETRSLVDSGVYSPLDRAVVTQQRHLVEQQNLELQTRILKASGKLAAMLDMPMQFFHGKHYEKPSVFEGKEPILSQGDLLENHLDLANLRARYEVAEKRLRLEIAKQFPDLQIGGNHNREPGENKVFYGLAIGVNLPVFDRNQVRIAEAAGARDEVFAQYEKEVANALISADSLFKQYQTEKQRQKHLDNSVVKQALRSRDLARDSFKTDQITLLRYWDFEEDCIEQQLKSSEGMIQLWQQQAELEALCGKPLTDFAAESAKR